MSKLPLHGLTVLEFSRYLSGPSAGLRLADLGARVIKIEDPQGGDPSRRLAFKNLWAGDDSLLFHTINRSKESIAASIHSPTDLSYIKEWIARADVLTHNYPPGVMEAVGLDYDSLRQINPRLVYASISGYGKNGDWQDTPGQDLLVQALSGLAYTTGDGQEWIDDLVGPDLPLAVGFDPQRVIMSTANPGAHTLVLAFCAGDPLGVWSRVAPVLADRIDIGFASPFLRTIPGTDTYVDEL